jgi:hypothetical protein
MKKIIFYAIVFLSTCISAQVYNPGYKITYTVNNDSSQSLNNYQVLLTVNTAQPISLGRMRMDGADIRFTADSCNPTAYYTYWIESGLNTDSTRIWVKVPFLASNSSNNFLMWYGDSLAVPQSDFTSTFPVSYISGGSDTTLSGIVQMDWFQLDTGDVLYLQQNLPLEIRSRVIKINGWVYGTGKGYAAPLSIANGNGPGGGGMSNSAGAGGGSYAGMGGMGGYDAGDSPGTGGPVYGLANDEGYPMGSSGGTTDNALGGNGGGAILLNAEWIDINGKIETNGLNGVGFIGRCGGGGTGGTIVIIGQNIDLDSLSTLVSTGGNGGNGGSPANDGGGGGSGGRIKVFHGDTNWNGVGNISVLGGSGGSFGSVSSGINGSNGTYHDSTVNLQFVYIAFSTNETALAAKITGLDSVYCLNKDSIRLHAEPAGGSFAGPGVFAGYFYPLLAGVGVHTISYMYVDPGGCGTLYDSVVVEVLNIPTSPFASNNSPLCEGDTLRLFASDSLSIHHWIGPNGFSSTAQEPIITNTSALNFGNYSVTISNPSGCSSTVITNVIVYSAPEASVTNNGPLCIDEELVFVASGGTTYAWQGPNGFTAGVDSPVLPHAQITAQGTYTVTLTGSEGCETILTSEVLINGCYANIDNHAGSFAIIYPNPSYNELWLELKETISEEIHTEFFDVYGTQLFQKTFAASMDNRYYIDVSTFATGTYFMVVSSNDVSKRFKIIKQ